MTNRKLGYRYKIEQQVQRSSDRNIPISLRKCKRNGIRVNSSSEKNVRMFSENHTAVPWETGCSDTGLIRLRLAKGIFHMIQSNVIGFYGVIGAVTSHYNKVQFVIILHIIPLGELTRKGYLSRTR